MSGLIGNGLFADRLLAVIDLPRRRMGLVGTRVSRRAAEPLGGG